MDLFLRGHIPRFGLMIDSFGQSRSFWRRGIGFCWGWVPYQ